MATGVDDVERRGELEPWSSSPKVVLLGETKMLL